MIRSMYHKLNIYEAVINYVDPHLQMQ